MIFGEKTSHRNSGQDEDAGDWRLH